MAATRDVASAMTSVNVSKLGVAWTVPLTIPTAHTDGAYATGNDHGGIDMHGGLIT